MKYNDGLSLPKIWKRLGSRYQLIPFIKPELAKSIYLAKWGLAGPTLERFLHSSSIS